MKPSLSLFCVSIFLFTASAAVAAAPASTKYNGKTYYAVKANDKNMNTGNKVCAAAGLTCVGYTGVSTNSICKAFHPGAKTLMSVNGSNAGFYCDGSPQKGLACAKFKNTCEVCVNCNTNMDCSTDLTSLNQVREAYVECAKPVPVKAMSSSSKAASSMPGHVSLYGPLPPVTIGTSKSSSSKSSAASGSVTCTFSNKPTKKVTCGAYKAADTFCVLAMQSTAAKATLCQDTGKIVCVLPCSAPGAKNLKQCAFGGVKAGSCGK